MRIRRQFVGVAVLLVGLGLLVADQDTRAQESAPGQIVKIFSVGGVLTADGTLWQYAPDRGWLTIDEAFEEQGKTTQILPLPVTVEQIEDLVTFGFILTTAGDCWLYDLDSNVWKKLDSPRR